jgi:hypothetical protein
MRVWKEGRDGEERHLKVNWGGKERQEIERIIEHDVYDFIYR